MAQTIATASSAAMSFFIAFFMEKAPFFFLPLAAPCILHRGGVGVWFVFGLMRKLCAGRAGFKLRASGREVQFSHLPSLRVCACGG